MIPWTAILGLCLLTASAVMQAGQAKTVNDGVYSEAQAARGQTAFENRCTNCHDTARFSGDAFIENWAGRPLADVFDVMSATMPEDNPGGLKPQQYADILSYILKLNGFAPGEELKPTPEAMRSVTIEAVKPK
jgi:mono/diheme cytochrome c family protein